MHTHRKCLIVDDETLATEVIKGYVDQIPQLELYGICTNAMEAFQVLQQQEIDFLFLDIEMPGMNGIEFIKSMSSTPHVILVTAFREYAIESYEIEVVDYLLKPVSFARFFKAVNKYLKLVEGPAEVPVSSSHTNPGGYMYVYSDKKNVKIYFDEVLYIESIKDYIRIHTTSKKIMSKSTISRYEELLPSTFVRVHRSFIVNTAKISAYTVHDIEIGPIEIPIGTSYKKTVTDLLKKF